MLNVLTWEMSTSCVSHPRKVTSTDGSCSFCWPSVSVKRTNMESPSRGRHAALEDGIFSFTDSWILGCTSGTGLWTDTAPVSVWMKHISNRNPTDLLRIVENVFEYKYLWHPVWFSGFEVAKTYCVQGWAWVSSVSLCVFVGLYL